MRILDALWRDLRHASRQLLANRGFASAAVVSLALGIGANTAIFCLVNEVLLRSLPVKDPGELVLLRAIEGRDGRMARGGENNGFVDPESGRNSTTSFSLLTFERLRLQRSALSDVFAFAPISQPSVVVNGEPEVGTVAAQLISGNYHAGLGVPAHVGRVLTTNDDHVAAGPVAVISFHYWDTRFARDAAAVGKTIALNRVPITIVGVTPPGFAGAGQAGESFDISVPLAHYLRFQPERVERAQSWYWWVRIMGRLAPGVTPAQARASFEPIFQQTAREGWVAGDSRDASPRAMPADATLAADPGARGESTVRRQYARSLYLLSGLAGLVLIAACANVANLLLARGTARRREIAVRVALGAGRSRIVRQLLAESLLLALAGAALGTALAGWGRPLLLALHPFGDTVLAFDLPLDTRVLGFTAAIAVVASILFGLAPALRATRLDLTSEFHGGARALVGSRSRFSQALMVVQIALSLVLLVAAGLFVRTLDELQGVDAGFERRQLLLFGVDARAAGYPREEFTALHARIQERLERIPGVRGATFSRIAVLSRVRQTNTVVVPGVPPPPGAPAGVHMNGVAANFFTTMALPIVLGRGFTEHDNAGGTSVGVVNQTLAARYFGTGNPIGRQIAYRTGPLAEVAVQIVGVAADAKYTDLRSAAPPTLYLPALQQIGGSANFAIRFDTPAGNRALARPPGALVAAVRAAVRGVDPSLPLLDVRTQDEQLDRLHSQELLFARLSGMFGVLALALACVGLYGLMSYAVGQRTSEIGLRMVLGAPRTHVLLLVLRESLALVALGVGVGLALAGASSRLIANMLFGVSPADPTSYGVVALVLTGVALVASIVPARRASRIDPMSALRAE